MTSPTTGLSEVEREALSEAVDGLRRRTPLASASRVLIPRQAVALAAVVILLAYFGATHWRGTLTVAIFLMMIVYIASLSDRMILFSLGLARSALVKITDEEALAIPEDELPTYTVLVPVYDEPGIIDQLVTGLGQLNYPRDLLDIKLLLEADDDATVAAVRRAPPDALAGIDVILVPAALPRTKPKACNYGLRFARGEIVTIYDAEDRPDPLQLRKVVAAYLRLPPSTACIQARLVYYNDRQNMLTRWFADEYDQWFGYILPGLMRVDAPIPLGGTSNHLRMDTLVEVGAWDPFNVTEDADLGIRLKRAGFDTAILDSVTLEEANSDVINWVRQRSRWYKGYIQTFLVHTRRPLDTIRAMGLVGFLRFSYLSFGTPFVSVVNLFMWTISLTWFLGSPHWVKAAFPPLTYYPAVVSLAFGNASIAFLGLVSARADGKQHLVVAGLTVPIYWLLMSVAAIKAFVQLITKPFYWEKTAHGLHEADDDDGQ